MSELENNEPENFVDRIKPVAKDLKQSLFNDQTNLFSNGPAIDVVFPDMPGGVDNQVKFTWGDPDFYDSFLKVLETVIQRILTSDPEFTLTDFLQVVQLAYILTEEDENERE